MNALTHLRALSPRVRARKHRRTTIVLHICSKDFMIWNVVVSLPPIPRISGQCTGGLRKVSFTQFQHPEYGTRRYFGIQRRTLHILNILTIQVFRGSIRSNIPINAYKIFYFSLQYILLFLYYSSTPHYTFRRMATLVQLGLEVAFSAQVPRRDLQNDE